MSTDPEQITSEQITSEQITSEQVTSECPLWRGPEGTYRLEAGGEVVDRHPDPRRVVAEALRLEAQLRAERPDEARED